MLKLSDSSLVARCINRDPLAWNGFVERFSALIFWVIRDRLEQRGYGYNQEDIKDIFQNVFVLLWEKKKLQQIRNREGISAWLAMVAANCTHNYFRSKRQDLFKKELVPERIASLDCSVSSAIERERLNSIIEEIFGFLTVRERIMLKLNYLYDKTHQDIAKLLKMPTNTISSLIKRTKERLKERLEKEGFKDF